MHGQLGLFYWRTDISHVWNYLRPKQCKLTFCGKFVCGNLLFPLCLVSMKVDIIVFLTLDLSCIFMRKCDLLVWFEINSHHFYSECLYMTVSVHTFVQIKQLNLPIMVKVFEWNAGGLISRIEGLRAFLPKAEMMRRPRNFTDLKNNVGRQIHVCITRTDERTNELIISEKEAWAMAYLREGALLEGTVRKLFPYGAQIRIGETNRGGLLHISKITHGQLRSVSDVLKVGERVKALVIKSTAPDRIALSIKDLESEPGLFLSDKEKVFSEAEEMAQRYRDQISETPRSDGSGSSCNHDAIAFEDEAESYVNWKWLKFIKSDEVNLNPSDTRSGL